MIHDVLALGLAAMLAGAVSMAGQPEKGGAPVPKPEVKQAERDDAAAEKLGWRLATQAWTFRDRTAFETVEIAQKLGLKYIEFYPGQFLSREDKEAKVGPGLTPEQRAALKQKLSECGVKAVNFGVVQPGRDQAQVREWFDFAKDMRLETITCEPQDEIAWDVVDKFCRDYNIRAACHNHPKPSQYWDPETVLRAIKGHDKRIGACADVGHFSRSGLDPVECLKKYEGKLMCLHFKDIKDGKDQPWGTGDGDARGMLRELRRQGFKGVIALEYESGQGKELEENAAKCVAFFDRVAREIVAEEEAAPAKK